MRLEAKKSTLSQMVWALGPAAFISVFSMSHVGTNLLGVCLTTGVTTIQGSWVATIEILMTMLGSLITPYISQGRPAIFFLMGAIIYGVSNLLFVTEYFQTNFVAVLAMRCVSSIGVMFYTPLIHLIEEIYVDPKDAVSLSASLKVIGAVAAIVTPFAGGVVAQIYSWRGMFVIGGAITAVHFFILMALMDFNAVADSQIKSDMVGAVVVTLAQMGLLAGVSLLEQPRWSLFCIISFVAGAVLYVYFFIHNYKLTDAPIVARAVVDRAHVLHALSVFLTNAARASESYFIAYIQILTFATPSWLSGSLITYANVSSFLFAPVVNNLRGLMFTKGSVAYMTIVYFVLIGLNSLNLLQFPTLFLFTSTNLLCGGFSTLANGFSGQLLPRISTPETASEAAQFSGLLGSLGASFGVTLAVTVQTFADTSYGDFTHSSFCAPYWASLVLLGLSLVCTLCVGQLGEPVGSYVTLTEGEKPADGEQLGSDVVISGPDYSLDLIKQFAA